MTTTSSPPDRRSAHIRAEPTAVPAGHAAADVYWPDPSPLDHWWTEVMDVPSGHGLAALGRRP
ncbi:hypothetical protein [Nocardia sp. NPDC019395]|uniref:hypothetical protein n=1 Tax=Nocardia sp. NPDC019395 TaxID=3154686 RepID=UPI0033E65AA0